MALYRKHSHRCQSNMPIPKSDTEKFSTLAQPVCRFDEANCFIDCKSDSELRKTSGVPSVGVHTSDCDHRR